MPFFVNKITFLGDFVDLCGFCGFFLKILRHFAQTFWSHCLQWSSSLAHDTSRQAGKAGPIAGKGGGESIQTKDVIPVRAQIDSTLRSQFPRRSVTVTDLRKPFLNMSRPLGRKEPLCRIRNLNKISLNLFQCGLMFSGLHHKKSHFCRPPQAAIKLEGRTVINKRWWCGGIAFWTSGGWGWVFPPFLPLAHLWYVGFVLFGFIQAHAHMGKQPNNKRGVNFSPVRRGVGLGGGRVSKRVRFCSQRGGRVWEKITKRWIFISKKMIHLSSHTPKKPSMN